jgi:hypothetical protein
MLRASGTVRLALPHGVVAELRGGVYLRSERPAGPTGAPGAVEGDPLPFDPLPCAPMPCHSPAPAAGDGIADPATSGPVTIGLALELLTVAAWLDREAARLRLDACSGTLASAWPALPSFAPGEALLPRREAA